MKRRRNALIISIVASAIGIIGGAMAGARTYPAAFIALGAIWVVVAALAVVAIRKQAGSGD